MFRSSLSNVPYFTPRPWTQKNIKIFRSKLNQCRKKQTNSHSVCISRMVLISMKCTTWMQCNIIFCLSCFWGCPQFYWNFERTSSNEMIYCSQKIWFISFIRPLNFRIVEKHFRMFFLAILYDWNAIRRVTFLSVTSLWMTKFVRAEIPYSA